MKPLFGTLNATLAKTIARNSPKHRRIVEPFADGGTYALHVGHKPAREHVVNLVDEALFGAMTFAQQASSADRARLKRMDWIASQETFDQVMRIAAAEGPDAFYRFLYVKKFGMAMDPEQPPEFDVLKAGQDISGLLYALPMMRAMLKSATIMNEEPISLLSRGGNDTLFILLPKKSEDAEAVQSRLSGISGNVFFAYKVLDAQGVIDAAIRFKDKTVSPLAVASIMMATMATVTNYESKLVPIDAATGAMVDMSMRARSRPVSSNAERRSIAKREYLRKTHLAAFEDGARRFIRRDIQNAERAIIKAFEPGGDPVSALKRWIEDFYPGQERVIMQAMGPIVTALAGATAVGVAEEFDAQPVDVAAFAQSYTENLASREAGSSRGQLLALIQEKKSEELQAALTTRLTEWGEKRPGKVATNEVVRVSSGAARHAYAAAGVARLTWRMNAGACLVCQQMDGRVAGVRGSFLSLGDTINPPGDTAPLTVDHDIVAPPLHEACGCDIVPE